MPKPLKCERCGENLHPCRFSENGKSYVEGLECHNCFNRLITSVMTSAEYMAMLEQDAERREWEGGLNDKG
jgi:hypothetical protein